ncbi:MAG: DNA-primase RepB domain-containing protein [Oscillochloridaceae bacterium umkhey_bin13]
MVAQRRPLDRPESLDRAARDMRRHLELLAEGWDGGRIELVAGTNDPANPDRIALLVPTRERSTITTTRRWLDPTSLAPIAAEAQRRAALWGNVYVSVGSFDQAERRYGLRWSREVPRPRRTVILDDVTDLDSLPLPPTWATQTSPGNHQVGYLCDALLTPHQAEQIGQGLALRVGADPSGWDAAQLIRLAGTLNTKPTCVGRPGNPDQGIEPEGWPVRLVRDDGPRYPIAQLAAVALPGGMHNLVSGRGATRSATRADRPGPDADDPDRPWRKAAYREALRAAADRVDVARLLGPNGLPRGLTQRQPGYAVLTAHQRGEIAYCSPSGNWDASRERWVVIGSLLRIGYNQAEVAALARELAAFGEEVKGSAAIWEDIVRVIVLTVAELGDAYKPRRPEPCAQSRVYDHADRPDLPRRRPGRPIGQRAQTASKLVRLLREQEGQIVTRAYLAQALALTERTITTHLAQLEQDGLIQLTREARGLRVEVNSPALLLGVSPAATLQDDAATVEHNSRCAEGVEGGSFAPFAASGSGSDSVGDHTRPLSPPCTLPADPTAPDACTAPTLHLVEPALPAVNPAPPEAAPAAQGGVCPPADPPIAPTAADQPPSRRWTPIPLTPAERALRDRHCRAPVAPTTEADSALLPPAGAPEGPVLDQACATRQPSRPEDHGTDANLEPLQGRGAWFDPNVRVADLNLPTRVARDGFEALAQLYDQAEKMGFPNVRPRPAATIAPLPAPVPLRRGPPRTPERLRAYHKLRGAAHKARSAKQRAWLLGEAAKLEEIYTPAEWRAYQQWQQRPAVSRPTPTAKPPVPQLALWESADPSSVTHQAPQCTNPSLAPSRPMHPVSDQEAIG